MGNFCARGLCCWCCSFFSSKNRELQSRRTNFNQDVQVIRSPPTGNERVIYTPQHNDCERSQVPSNQNQPTVISEYDRKIRELEEQRRREQLEFEVESARVIERMKESTNRFESSFPTYHTPTSNYEDSSNRHVPDYGSTSYYIYDESQDQKRWDNINELKKKKDEEIEELNREADRQREVFKQNQKNYELKSELDKAELARIEREHEMTMHNQKTKFDENMEKIRKDAEKQRIASENKWREREKILDMQLQEIMKNMKMSYWNDRIEQNWTTRLNFMRSANKEVERLCNSLLREIKFCIKSSSFENDIKILKKHRIPPLIVEINKEKSLMDSETYAMEVMYKNTEKKFLLMIKKSTDKVSMKCEELIDALLQFEINGPDLKNHELNIEVKLDKLRHASLNIPTLAMLRKYHDEEMENNENGKESHNNGESYNVEEVV